MIIFGFSREKEAESCELTKATQLVGGRKVI
jgi:hypothetical protein